MKTITLRFRCTEEEAAEIRQCANESGHTLSEWCRRRLIESKTVIRDAAEYEQRTDHHTPPAKPAGTIRIAGISADHRDTINNHLERSTREFQPYTKADQAGRKPK